MTHVKDLPVSQRTENTTEQTAGLLGMDLKGGDEESDDEDSNDELSGDDDETMEENTVHAHEAAASRQPSVDAMRTDEPESPGASSSKDRTQNSSDPPRAAEEAHAMKIRPSPTLPSPKEVAEHDATHCPYRSWCPVCVSASGHEAPHNRRSERDEETCFPVISLDYEALEDEIKFLAVKDEMSGTLLS